MAPRAGLVLGGCEGQQPVSLAVARTLSRRAGGTELTPAEVRRAVPTPNHSQRPHPPRITSNSPKQRNNGAFLPLLPGARGAASNQTGSVLMPLPLWSCLLRAQEMNYRWHLIGLVSVMFKENWRGLRTRTTLCQVAKSHPTRGQDLHSPSPGIKKYIIDPCHGRLPFTHCSRNTLPQSDTGVRNERGKTIGAHCAPLFHTANPVYTSRLHVSEGLRAVCGSGVDPVCVREGAQRVEGGSPLPGLQPRLSRDIHRTGQLMPGLATSYATAQDLTSVRG
ncbi:hypothetical protein NDU88_002564 [Pleurodeles waltl]|uniref:Uncharacterized protein n=1 Tax=Pleurodeles waltl TaxID=8319 RepID=A0AAV7W022_PLEWA|nr:hypothetical protein NDU88_002564 [Pleurodeles waltl]